MPNWWDIIRDNARKSLLPEAQIREREGDYDRINQWPPVPPDSPPMWGGRGPSRPFVGPPQPPDRRSGTTPQARRFYNSVIRPMVTPIDTAAAVTAAVAPPTIPYIAAAYAADAGRHLPKDAKEFWDNPGIGTGATLGMGAVFTALPASYAARQLTARVRNAARNPVRQQMGEAFNFGSDRGAFGPGPFPPRPTPSAAGAAMDEYRRLLTQVDKTPQEIARMQELQAGVVQRTRPPVEPQRLPLGDNLNTIENPQLVGASASRNAGPQTPMPESPPPPRGQQAPPSGAGGSGSPPSTPPPSMSIDDLGRVTQGPETFQERFANWVNGRTAASQEGVVIRRQFTDLDDLGLDGIKSFETGSKNPRFRRVKSYFDNKHKELSAAGTRMGFRDDYLPHLWAESTDEINAVMNNLDAKGSPGDGGRKLGLNAPFTYERTIESYKEGMKAGLTPRHKTIGELTGWYEQTANKLLEDRQMFGWLKDNGFIQSGANTPSGWQRVDGFPTNRILDKDTNELIKETVYSAQPDVAKVLNNYLGDFSGPRTGSYSERFQAAPLVTLADTATTSKQMVLSSGIPDLTKVPDIFPVLEPLRSLLDKTKGYGSGINAHGINIMMRAARSPHASGMMVGKWLLNPGAAQNFLRTVDDDIVKWTRAGLKMTTEEQAFNQINSGLMEGTILGKALAAQEDLFGHNLFQRIIPATKMKSANTIMAEYVRAGMPEADAMRAASKLVNSTFGGINWQQVIKIKDGKYTSRSPELQQWFRASILAPDWMETNLISARGMPSGAREIAGQGLSKLADYGVAPDDLRRFAQKIRNSPDSVAAREYAGRMKSLAGTYIAATGFQRMTQGTWMHENEPGMRLNVKLGTTADGKMRSMPISLGTGDDWARVPIEILADVFNGDLSSISRTARYRMSIPADVYGSLRTNTDYVGRPLFGSDRYGQPIPFTEQVGNLASTTSRLFAPQAVQAAIDRFSGRIGTEEAVVQAAEIPLRHRRPYIPQQSARPSGPGGPRR